MPYDLITISREYGAGASHLAELLGARLGWPVLDAGIPAAVATRLHLDPDSLEQWDEHAPRLLETLGNALMLGTPDVLIDPAYVSRPHPRDVAVATRALLLEAAATLPLIIVGHGGQVIFAARPCTLHLRLVAPVTQRCPRIMARRSCSAKEAVAIANHVDRDRAQYVRDYLDRDVHDPHLYALQINTGAVAMELAVDMVAMLIGQSVSPTV